MNDVDKVKQAVRPRGMKENLSIYAVWLFYILYALLCIFLFCLFQSSLVIRPGPKKLQEFSAEDGSDQETRTRWMRSRFRAGHG